MECKRTNRRRAGTLVAGFVVKRVSLARVKRALEAVAEAALSFGATVAVGAPDTVWVDVTGSAHLFGESRLSPANSSAVFEAWATPFDWPCRAVPRWRACSLAISGRHGSIRGSQGVFVVPKARLRAALADLPVIALPLGDELRDSAGAPRVLTISDLLELPRTSLGPRLGADADHALEIAAGRDREPLTAFQPARSIVEAVSWELRRCGD